MIIKRTGSIHYLWILCLAAALFWTGQDRACAAPQDHHSAPVIPASVPHTPVIIAAIPKAEPPRYSLTIDGKPSGQAVEIFDAIARNAGVSVHYTILDTWADVVDALKTGDADVVPNIAITEERKAFAEFTVPLERFKVILARRIENGTLSDLPDLDGHTVATVDSIIPLTIFNDHSHIILKHFSSNRQALDALLQNGVDATALPEPVFTFLVHDVRVSDRVTALPTPLGTVYRGIAVRKGNTALFERLNAATKAYVQSPHHTAVLEKWRNGLRPPQTLWRQAWALVLVLSAGVILVGIWKHRRLRAQSHVMLPETNGHKLGQRLRYRGVLLTVILILCIAITAGSTLVLLYQVAFDKQRERLIEMVESQARLMEAIAQFNAQYSADVPGGPTAATLHQITTGLSRYQGVGEFTLAQKVGNNIVFLLRQRAWNRYQPAPVPLNSDLAEPMRQALLGHSGTIIAKDYRGVPVLAAFEPVPTLNLGVVAKVDIAEIQAPYIEAGLTTAAIGFFVVILGTTAFVAVGDPLVRQLVDREYWFAAIIQHAGVGIALIDADSRTIIKANERFALLLGVSDPARSITPLARLFPQGIGLMENPNRRPHHEPAYPASTSTEITIQHPNGNRLWLRVLVSPVGEPGYAPGYAPTRYVIVLDDITEKKRAETLRDDVERILRHDLRSPVAATLSGLELLRRRPGLTDADHHTLDMIEQVNRTQLTMLDMSMAVNRMESGTFEIDAVPVDLDAVLTDIIRELDHLKRHRNAEIQVLGSPSLQVVGDGWLCRTILGNLIRNALEALPGPGLTVTLTRTAAEDTATIAITNPGSVPMAIRDRFFEKYVTMGKSGGTGLGTYSASLMTRAQGGTITLNTATPGYTTVTVQLPTPPESRRDIPGNDPGGTTETITANTEDPGTDPPSHTPDPIRPAAMGSVMAFGPHASSGTIAPSSAAGSGKR